MPSAVECASLLVAHLLCLRWGYTQLSDLEAVVANYSRAGLALEGLWVDIELMNSRFQVFTFDKGACGQKQNHV